MLAPAPVAAPAPRERVTLWQGELRSREAPRAFPNTWRRSNPPCSTRWRSARVLEMSLPGRERPAGTPRQHPSAGLPVWRGGLVDGDEAESLTVVRGSLETHQCRHPRRQLLDHRRQPQRQDRVIDENDIAARSDPHGDHVDAPLAELPPMPPPAQAEPTFPACFPAVPSGRHGFYCPNTGNP